MTRRFAEVVHVGLEDAASGRSDDARPVAFQWRGQRYVVKEVLGHWRERRAWWAGGADQVLAQAVRDLSLHHDLPRPASRAQALSPTGLSGPAGPAEPVPAQRSWADQLGEEYEVWRVEARRSWGTATGVYDLCHDGYTHPALSTWRLLRMVD